MIHVDGVPPGRPSGWQGRVGGQALPMRAGAGQQSAGPQASGPQASGPPQGLLCTSHWVPSAGASGPPLAARCWHLCSRSCSFSSGARGVEEHCSLCEHVNICVRLSSTVMGMTASTLRLPRRVEHGRFPQGPVQVWQSVWPTAPLRSQQQLRASLGRSAPTHCSGDAAYS